ncbi:Sec-independent protein translocase protein TatB [Thiospirillum jenense]|uniref:Sec-independent protein translocase protein TatB n=1 Tax=Thiospirillum jenense TaxID=1653858 RepID=A0A839HGY7_9GAMM|nr:Sec-independent protein translocase protein TatB [Thiospirillum jenense]MBB1127220.1 twin-arginine translocase subunit TatB [Thiospirillum jenense]
MFDVGAQELILIGIVALIVVGPERMPRLARAAGLWFGRARRALLSVKLEIDQELKAEELREIMRKQSINRPLETLITPPAVTMKSPPPAPPITNDPSPINSPNQPAAPRVSD